MERFTSINGEGQSNERSELDKLRELAEQYSCGIDDKPNFCVYGSHPDMGAGVLYWIKPGKDEEFIAGKMTQLIRSLGGKASSEKTEFNHQLQGPPVYQSANHLGFVLNYGLIPEQSGDGNMIGKKDVEKRLLHLINNNTCGIDAKPRWCVSGTGVDGSGGILYWIKPETDDKQTAIEIADLINQSGGKAKIEPAWQAFKQSEN